MKTIEINTAQQVTIQYELSNTGNRFLAYFIDVMIVAGVSIFLTILGSQAFYDRDYFFYFTVGPVILFYSLVSEILLNGQTLGKKALGLKIVKLNGDAPTPHDYFMRWIFRAVDIFLSAGAVGALLISSSPKSQRLGGILSGTTIIKMNSSRSFSLNDILRISTTETYQPLYPQVTNLSEEDMLFIKKVIERVRQNNNEAHKQVVIKLVKHVAGILEIKNIPKNYVLFLRTLIQDYIVLTR